MSPPVEEEAAVDKPMVYEDDDGRFVYRASALLSCQNALLAARMGAGGAAPPEKMQKRFDEGHEQEALILAKAEANYGFVMYGHQQEVEISVGSNTLIRGHVDALSELTAARFDSVDGDRSVHELPNRTSGLLGVIDAKALAPAGYDTWVDKGFEAYLYYLWQQGVYLYGLGFDAVVMAVKNKVTGDISVDCFTLAYYKQRLPKSTLLQRVMTVEKWAKDPDSLFSQPCSPKMWPCPFFHLHPASERAERSEDATGDMDELAVLAGKVREGEVLIAQGKEMVDKYKPEIAKFVGNKRTFTRLSDVTVSTSFGSTSSPDWKAIAEHLDMDVTADEAKAEFTVKKTNKKLTVKVTPKET